MLMFCHHTKSHQGCSVASVGMWRVYLLDLSCSLQIIRRRCDKIVCLTYFNSVSQLFFHFNAVSRLCWNRVIDLQSEPLDRLLCDCTNEMIRVKVPNLPLFFSVVSILSEALDHSRIIVESLVLSCTVVMTCVMVLW